MCIVMKLGNVQQTSVEKNTYHHSSDSGDFHYRLLIVPHQYIHKDNTVSLLVFCRDR